jgi:uncharacterized protein YceH (UPF0502 family)
VEPLTPEEVRVAGCLVEKQLTTPDSYPLTQNALIAACNQLSNRQPVVSYDDATVRQALAGLRAKQLARVVHIPGSRVPKHRHVLDETLGLERTDLALLAVLSLRGPQTPGELRTRTERLCEFASLAEVEEKLEALAARPEPLVVRLERQPGQKEARYAHLLGGTVDEGTPAGSWAPPGPAPATGEAVPTGAPTGADHDRLSDLEARLAAVEAGLEALRRELGLGSEEAS